MTSGKTKYNIFSFKYGKEPKDIKHYAKLSLLIHGSLDIVSILPGVDKKKAFTIFDKIVRTMNIESLNDFIIKDEELLTYRVENIVDDAINKYDKNNGL
jgi:hypothetical protein